MTDFTRRGFFRAVGALLPKAAAVAVVAHGVVKSKPAKARPAQASTLDNLPNQGEWEPDEARVFYASASVSSDDPLEFGPTFAYRRED